MFGKKFCKYFKKIDLFPQRVELLIDCEDNHKTLMGAAMTICITTVISILFYDNIQQVLAYSNPTSMMTEGNHDQPNKFLLNPTNFTIALALQHSNYSSYIDESIYIVDATYRQKIINNGQEQWQSLSIGLIPCSLELIQQVELQDYYNRLILPSMYCLDYSSIIGLSLEGTFDAKVFSFIHFAVKICNEQNRRIGGPKCREPSEVTAALESNQLGIYLSSNTIDLKNQYHPHKPIGENIFTTTSSRMVKSINIYMQPLTTISDMGLISEELTTKQSLRYGHYTEMLDMIQSDTFLKIAIRLENVESVNYRHYDKIQNVIGQLGGLWNVLFFIAMLLQKPFSYITYQLSIMNSMFTFESETDSQKKCDSIIEDAQSVFQDHLKLPQINRTKRLHKRSALKLNSIIEHSKYLDTFKQSGNLKVNIAESVSVSIEQYFKIASKQSQLRVKEYVQYLLMSCCKINEKKQKQIEYAKQKINKQLDILYIVSKLQEIDKLKMLVLGKEQLQVFDYLPKPSVPLDVNAMALIQNQYFSILNPSKGSYEKTLEAQRAFTKILQDPFNSINQKLLESMDFETAQLLKSRRNFEPRSRNQSEEEINSEISKSIAFPSRSPHHMIKSNIQLSSS